MRKVQLRGCPIECGEYFTRFLFACWRYINNGIADTRDILAKILHTMDKRSKFNLQAASSGLSYFGFSFQYNLVTIGVPEFVVVIDVYAQPAREKIKFYRTVSEIAQGRMASLAIVEDFDEFENVVPGFVAGLVVAMMHQLGFQCVEKTFHRRIIPTVSLAAH